MADIDWGKRSLCVRDGSSLTCLAADEPEPYCLNDGEKVWLGELEGAGLCLRMRLRGNGKGEGVPHFPRRPCSLVAHSQ